MTKIIISSSRLRAGFLAGISVLSITAAGPARADSSTALNEQSNALDDIIVTARKRDESIMKTPVIIQVLPAKEIELREPEPRPIFAESATPAQR